MANLPISGLPTASALDGTELLPFVQGGVTTQANVQDILDANLPVTSSGITVSGDIVPTTPQGATLGTIDKPFADLYLQSGSITIESDTPGDPSAIISNFNGNVDIKAAGFSVTSGSISPFIINNQGQIKIQNKYQDPQNEAIFQVIGNNEGSQSAAVNPGSMIQITGFDGVPNRNVFDSYGGGGVFSQVILRNAAGTAANPTSTVAGIIGRVATSGYITDVGFGIEGVTDPPASMNFYTPGYRSGSRETMIRFYATADNELDPNGYSAVIKAEGMEVTGSVDVSGSFTASLQEDYVWVGDSNNRSIETPISSLSTYLTGSLVSKAYGSFFDTTTQSGSANTAYAIKHNTTDLSSDVSIVSDTRITMAEAGVYTIISTQQFKHTSGGTVYITGWLRKNGVDVANSAIDLTLKGNGDTELCAVNYFVEAAAGDYFELIWSATDSSTEIVYQAARTSPTRPAVPSVITTVNRVG
jgi:hypothetical protein